MTHPLPEPHRDAGKAAQAAAEAHLEACTAALDAAEDAQDSDAYAEAVQASPAAAPFDGCTTCEVRETLAAAWPIIVADCAAVVELAGHPGAAKILQGEAARMALPVTPTHGEGVHA